MMVIAEAAVSAGDLVAAALLPLSWAIPLAVSRDADKVVVVVVVGVVASSLLVIQGKCEGDGGD